ncbi:MAG: NUDIX domain-containing protein [Chloroflexota bacterium]
MSRLDPQTGSYFYNMIPKQQQINPDRYTVIPRVLIFPLRENEVLLLKKKSKNGQGSQWENKYNGPGGHIEKGEDVYSAASRELFEETGLSGQLTLCGIIMINTGSAPGICLYIFKADQLTGILSPSKEGDPAWLQIETIQDNPLVEDVPLLLAKIKESTSSGNLFSGIYQYEDPDKKTVAFFEHL